MFYTQNSKVDKKFSLTVLNQFVWCQNKSEVIAEKVQRKYIDFPLKF